MSLLFTTKPEPCPTCRAPASVTYSTRLNGGGEAATTYVSSFVCTNSGCASKRPAPSVSGYLEVPPQ